MKSTAERKRDHDRRKREAGLRQVTVWVPESRADELRQFAKWLCDQEGRNERE